jgi:hypothetical protein
MKNVMSANCGGARRCALAALHQANDMAIGVRIIVRLFLDI